jgi:nitroreductase
MNTLPADAVLQQLNWRYATKKFDPARKIPADLWTKLEHSAILAPSSFGLQPWRFIVVETAATREKLKAHAWNQSQITDASHLLVFATKSVVSSADVEAYVQRIIDVRKAPAAAVEPFKQMMLGFISQPGLDHKAWNTRQVYIALGFFLSACAMVGVDACPMEGIEAPKFDEILGLTKDGFNTVVVAAAGYRAADDAFASFAKVRFDAAAVVKHA